MRIEFSQIFIYLFIFSLIQISGDIPHCKTAKSEQKVKSQTEAKDKIQRISPNFLQMFTTTKLPTPHNTP